MNHDLPAANLDVATLSASTVRNMSARKFNSISSHLEDWNQHSENTVFLALRVGTDADIDEARAIFADHERAGELTPDLSRRRHHLLKKLSGIPEETEAEKLIPPASASCGCGYSIAAPGVGYWSAAGWVCKKCGEIHTPLSSPTVTIPRALLEQLSIVCFMAAPNYSPDMPEVGKAKLEAIANQAFEILNSSNP
jgi:hypothetical protein